MSLTTQQQSDLEELAIEYCEAITNSQRKAVLDHIRSYYGEDYIGYFLRKKVMYRDIKPGIGIIQPTTTSVDYPTQEEANNSFIGINSGNND